MTVKLNTVSKGRDKSTRRQTTHTDKDRLLCQLSTSGPIQANKILPGTHRQDGQLDRMLQYIPHKLNIEKCHNWSHFCHVVCACLLNMF